MTAILTNVGRQFMTSCPIHIFRHVESHVSDRKPAFANNYNCN
jgi:hypothetical protein